MPYKRKTKRKQPYRRRKKNNNSYVTLVNPVRSPMPDRYLTTIGYNLVIPQIFNDLLPIGGNPNEGYILIRQNSIFDPEQRLGGKFGVGTKQLAALYGRSTVVASSIKCQFVSWSSTTNDNIVEMMVLPIPTDQLNTNANLQDLSCNRKASKTVLVGPNVGMSKGTVYNKTVTKRLFGVKDIMDDVSYSQDPLLANPPIGAYWQIVFRNGGTNPLNTPQGSVSIHIEYKVMFTNLRTLDDNE